MSSITIQYLSSSAADAKRLASRLGIAAHEIALHYFPDGEMRVTAGPATSTTIIYASLDRPNDKLIAILFAAEALRRQGSKRLVLLAPYLCYMRQDTAFHEGEAISQKAVGQMIVNTVDRVITVDAHLHRTPDIRVVFPGIDADNLSAMPAITGALRAENIDPATVVVGPDAESRQWASYLAESLGLTCAVAQKARHGDQSVELRFANPSLFAGRPALITDDIVSSGGTLIACAKALSAAGATVVDAVVTHALFPPELMVALANVGIHSIRSTHSVPHATNTFVLDDLFASALHREFGDTILFEAIS
ncbi:ribose-phosphate pyrophosphokinase (plasmid) [Nitrobacter sp. NHB1]|uniref:ribose-phosphate pyrophosphokinase n=1 Tax=Nitrobacter sp. NHB1 TaxID=3119830 RepID=UPI002FFF1EC8